MLRAARRVPPRLDAYCRHAHSRATSLRLIVFAILITYDARKHFRSAKRDKSAAARLFASLFTRAKDEAKERRATPQHYGVMRAESYDGA